MTYVLDASSLLRMFENEAGAERVEKVLSEAQVDEIGVVMSAVNWGEVAACAWRKFGPVGVPRVMQHLLALRIDAIPATSDRAVRAALLKAEYKLPYADSFAAEAAMAADHVLLTADFDFKLVEAIIRVEFLPAKNSGPQAIRAPAF